MRIARIGVSPSDRKGATEQNISRIAPVDADEALGYRGRGREEHSGEPVADGETRGSWRDRPRRRRHLLTP